MTKYHWLVVTLFVASFSCYGHVDIVISIDSDGRLSGLPEKYQPAFFEARFSDEPAKRLQDVTLTIGPNSTTVPFCAASLINTPEISGVSASASWYHLRSGLPPYLYVQFLDPGSDMEAWPYSGYSLLFDLNSSKLMEMKRLVGNRLKRSQQQITVSLEESCSPGLVEQFTSGVAPP